MTKRERRSRKHLLANLQLVPTTPAKLPPCVTERARDLYFEPTPDERSLKPPVPAEQLLQVSSAELFEMIQAAGSLEEPPYAGLIGLLSEQMAGQL